MDRIATNTAYSSMLANLMKAELAQSKAGSQLSTQEKATDLKGYAGGAESLTAMQATMTQVTGYLNNSQLTGAKLSLQDSALSQVEGSATSAVSAITNAIAVGSGTGLMSQLESAFEDAVQGLNTTYDGQYLFAGGQVNTQPVSATNLSDLTSAPSIASLFHNDQRVTSTQVDQNTSVSTGFLADQVGTPLFTALQAIEAYDQGPNGPLGATLTQAQTDFLTQQLSGMKTVETNLTQTTAANGLAQSMVEKTQSALSSRQDMLQGLIDDQSQADVAKAATDLQQAQYSIQAAGQIFQALNSASLLNSLSAPSALG
ncbi:MAG TPA: flagellin [Caulobacteraceae bacterium]|jgi:flagellar hook-associated protein 3 FlgL|nr:flagellin [Caulobacteraceae bacterium]